MYLLCKCEINSGAVKGEGGGGGGGEACEGLRCVTCASTELCSEIWFYKSK